MRRHGAQIVGAADTVFYSFFFLLYYLKREDRPLPSKYQLILLILNSEF